jgi:PhoPQ-activated pathogenicity-related protein
MIADREELPKVTWARTSDDSPNLEMAVTPAAKNFRLWTATSPDRDLRNDRWSSVEVPSNPGRKAAAQVERPAAGFRAYLMEADFVTKSGHSYKLSTEARVVPDTAPQTGSARSK